MKDITLSVHQSKSLRGFINPVENPAVYYFDMMHKRDIKRYSSQGVSKLSYNALGYDLADQNMKNWLY